jgi:hypothetical protein
LKAAPVGSFWWSLLLLYRMYSNSQHHGSINKYNSLTPYTPIPRLAQFH